MRLQRPVPVPATFTPNAMAPPDSEMPKSPKSPAYVTSRSTMTLPTIHASSPGVHDGESFSAASAFIQNSSVKSVAPTSAGRAGASMGIFTRSMSSTPLPWKRSA